MKEIEINLVKSILGEDFFEVLAKSEGGSIFKENTKTATSPEDIKIALQIVPRAILGWLFSNLKWREVGDIIDLELPFAKGRLQANKLSPDNYSGEIISEGERAVKFKYRSLPSIGLIIMSTFELYDMKQLDEIKGEKSPEQESKIDNIQNIIDERLSLHSMVGRVVDQKITQREAISQLIRARLTHSIEAAQQVKEEEPVEQSKKSKLKDFLDNREKKIGESVELDKSEDLSCPDCNFKLYKSEEKNIKLCVCYGDHMHKEIKIKKASDGRVNLKFPKSFDSENIEMLLDALKNK